MAIVEVLNEQTPIALGAVISFAVGGGTALVWLIRGISQIRDGVRDVKGEMALLREEMRNRVDGALKREAFLRWVSRLQSLNENMTLPEEAP